MRRREFMALASWFIAWPQLASGQSSERKRRIGLLSPFSERDTETQARLAAFKQLLDKLGWTEGRNIQIDLRFSDGNPERTRVAAAELIALAPDVLVAYANPAVSALKPLTQAIPIVFTQVSAPIESGFVSNLAKPEGNITGFHSFEPSMGGKWLELLKEIAPRHRRVAVVYDPNIAANVAFLRAAEAASPSFGMAVTEAPVRDGADIERAITAFAQELDGGLIWRRPQPHSIDVTSSSHWRSGSDCPPSIRIAFSSRAAAWRPMVSRALSNSRPLRPMSIESCVAQSRLNFRCSSRLSTNW
jgi:ABC-type uncharacterized transport system substrate-binding protein